MKFPPLPKSKFNVIYPDPPWPYRDKGKAGNRGASTKYKTIPLPDLILLPVEKLASRHCACLMWTPDTFIKEAVALMKAWGFVYKRVAFVWVKTTKDGSRNLMTLGRYTRSNAEFVLLGVKGAPKVKSHSINQIYASPTIPNHVKPQEIRERIEKLFGDVKRIELFARNRKHIRDGWSYWGDQA